MAVVCAKGNNTEQHIERCLSLYLCTELADPGPVIQTFFTGHPPPLPSSHPFVFCHSILLATFAILKGMLQCRIELTPKVCLFYTTSMFALCAGGLLAAAMRAKYAAALPMDSQLQYLTISM